MRKYARWIFTALMVALAAGDLAWAAELQGGLELLNRRGSKPARGVDPREAVIWWEPAGAMEVEPLAEAVMTTEDKEFAPRVLVVTQGTTVGFPNLDPILHNVFSVSGDNTFDLGFYREGPGETYTFEADGVVRIFCNVHHSMVAYVLVLGTPYWTHPAKDGSFRLEGLPDGPGHLVVWHERSDEPERHELTLPSEGKVELSLKMTRARIPKHLNKTGRPYARSDDY